MKGKLPGLIAALFCLSCVTVAVALTPPAPPPVPAQPATAEVSVAATPGSVCRFDPRAIPKGGKSPILPTDRTGHAHFYLSAGGAKTKTAVSVALVCEDAASRKTQVTAHVAPADFVVRKPASGTVMKAPKAASHLGALAGGKIDVTTASDADLERLGYPARPDRIKAPRAYAAWLYIVTTPGVYAKPVSFPIPGRHAVPITPTPSGGVVKPAVGKVISNKAWAGYSIVASPLFNQVNAFWAVPTVITPPFTQTTEAAQWVGIDGDNEPDVIQDGTDTDSITVLCSTGNGPFDFPYPCNISYYYAWYQYLPDDTKGINNFNVRPGDSMQVVTYITLSGSLVVGHFIVWNMTLNQAATFSESAPDGVNSALDQVEWVVERPTESGDITLLSQTGPTHMVDAAFTRNNGPETTFNGPTQTLPISQLAMTQDGSVLNANNLMSLGVTGSHPGELFVYWYKFK